MSTDQGARRISRRGLLKLGGGLVAGAVGAALLPRWSGRVLSPVSPADANNMSSLTVDHYRHLIAADGWIHLPGSSAPENGVVFSPDPYAQAQSPVGMLTNYVFGFRDVTSLDPAGPTPSTTTEPRILAQKGHVQNSAPLLYFDEDDKIQIMLTNTGFQQRPDLHDSHTIHWHGFRNALPLFDGVPEMSISVPIGKDFPYFYHPTDPGTYMYHCHFEDVEHVQMGMTGIVFVRPAQNKTGNGAGAPVARYNGGGGSSPLGYVYNDGVAPGNPLSTAYDREFGLFLTEVWALAHWYDAHIQQMDWSEYHADFYTMNGRSYPDTIAPNGGAGGYVEGPGAAVAPWQPDPATGDMVAPPGHPELQFQPISSLVRCNAGEKVLLRFVNLGYTQAAMRLSGIKMHIVGKDATPMRGLPLDANGRRMGADTSYYTDTVYLGAGESYDAIFTAPTTGALASSDAFGAYDRYLLYNNALGTLTTPGPTAAGLGGQMTEVRVYGGGLPAQTIPNT